MLERIQALEPQFRGEELERLRAKWFAAAPVGLDEDAMLGLDASGGSRLPNADDLSIAQTYLDLYFQEKSPGMLTLTKAEMDDLLPLATLKPNDARIPWGWGDALFMAPPVWAKMYKATR